MGRSDSEEQSGLLIGRSGGERSGIWASVFGCGLMPNDPSRLKSGHLLGNRTEGVTRIYERSHRQRSGESVEQPRQA